LKGAEKVTKKVLKITLVNREAFFWFLEDEVRRKIKNSEEKENKKKRTNEVTQRSEKKTFIGVLK
jgi:hypothetical protein